MIEDDKYQTRMDQFQYVECGMVSKDGDKVKKHMLAAHKIKVETYTEQELFLHNLHIHNKRYE